MFQYRSRSSGGHIKDSLLHHQGNRHIASHDSSGRNIHRDDKTGFLRLFCDFPQPFISLSVETEAKKRIVYGSAFRDVLHNRYCRGKILPAPEVLGISLLVEIQHRYVETFIMEY